MNENDGVWNIFSICFSQYVKGHGAYISVQGILV